MEIRNLPMLEVKRNDDGSGSIRFERQGKKMRSSALLGLRSGFVFENISDVESVCALIRRQGEKQNSA